MPNMKNWETKCCGIDVSIPVPADRESYVELCGPSRTGDPLLDDATVYVLYHSTLGTLRKKFAAAVEKATEVAWKMKDSGRKDKAGKAVMVPDEGDGAYIARAAAESGKEVTDFSDLMTTLITSGEVKFDPSVAVRESSPREVAKSYLNAANELWTDPTTSGKVQQLAAKLLELNPDTKFEDEDKDEEGQYTIKGLARLISVNEARKRRAASLKKQYASVEELA